MSTDQVSAFKPAIKSDGITMADFLKSEKEKRDRAIANSKERWNQMATIILPDNFDLDALLAGSRKKGLYREVLQKFIDSEEKGVQIDLENGEFKGKNINTIMAGFKNAVEKLNVNVRVINSDENVYLVNMDLA